MRTLPVLAVLTALATAGCIGALNHNLDPDHAHQTTLPHTSTLAWSTHDPLQEQQDTLTVPTPPEDIGAIHIQAQASAQTPMASLTATLELPNGETYPIITQSTLAQANHHETWQILPGFNATQAPIEIHIQATGETSLETTIHLQTPTTPPTPTPTQGPDEPSIIAIVDTGINPYHDAFQRPHLTTDQLPQRIHDATYDQPPLSIPTKPLETYTQSLQHDAATWTHIPDNQLLHFENTNILGIDLRETTLPQLPLLDRSGHGTAVAHAATEENPHAILVMITANDYDDGVRWAAQQPWIDLISLSWGPAVNAAGAAEPHLFGFDTYDATRQAHEQGKLVFTATGNDPTPAFTDTTSGPPWVHAVSGAEPDANGRTIMSGNLVDTVANWTQTLALHTSTNDTGTASGTSFATPTTAGIASKILHDVRSHAGHEGNTTPNAMVQSDTLTLTSSDLREALNQTARYWDTTDYDDPTAGPSLPAAPLPWINMGWGYLDGSIVETATNALIGHKDLPEKPQHAQTYMEANLELRQTWWHDVQQG